MPNAEIITIGTEILLGEIVDTNAQYLARSLRDHGIDLFRTTSVGDNPDRIALAIQEGLGRSNIIITTGGLGPTVDDPTRQAVALAVGVPTEFRPDLWDQIQARFRRYGRLPTENNRRQAYIPQGAIPVENPVGTAPSFIVETDGRSIIALPGVPREMEFLMQQAVIPYLCERYEIHSIIKARVLHTAGVGESQIDDRISDLEALDNPTVGLAAHSGQVDVRITAKAETEAQADNLIAEVEQTLRQRLGDWIYGADQESLERIALDVLQARGWQLVVVEAGLRGELSRRLTSSDGPFLGGEVRRELPDPETLADWTEAYRQARQAEIGLGVTILRGAERQEVRLVLITPHARQEFSRPFGGPPEYAPRWATHHALDVLRHIT
jgi:competence/damage-inducible protein CinA-like protein